MSIGRFTDRKSLAVLKSLHYIANSSLPSKDLELQLSVHSEPV